MSIRLDSVIDNLSIVEIKYRADSELDGVELMGVDADLSWLKGESVKLKKGGHDGEQVIYIGYLSVKDSCEFRARGYKDETDYWESGLGNHNLHRTSSGTIQFETFLEDDMYEFWGDLPIDYEPDEEEILQRIEMISSENQPKLLQTLIDLHYWIKPLFEDPLDENKIHVLPSIQRYLKEQARSYNSHRVDEVVRAVVKALFHMYKSALDFAGDDIRFLLGEWETAGFQTILEQIPQEVKSLEKTKLGVGKDAEARFRDLLNYV